MMCPHCGDRDSRCLETRDWKGAMLKRTRECLGCGRRYATYEVTRAMLRLQQADRYARGIARRARSLTLRIALAALDKRHPPLSAARAAEQLGTSATFVLNARRRRAATTQVRTRAERTTT